MPSGSCQGPRTEGCNSGIPEPETPRSCCRVTRTVSFLWRRAPPETTSPLALETCALVFGRTPEPALSWASRPTVTVPSDQRLRRVIRDAVSSEEDQQELDEKSTSFSNTARPFWRHGGSSSASRYTIEAQVFSRLCHALASIGWQQMTWGCPRILGDRYSQALFIFKFWVKDLVGRLCSQKETKKN